MNKRIRCVLSTLALLTLTGMTAKASSQYTVISGDSLWKISQKYNTTVSEIKLLNNLSGDTIYAGQKLAVPDLYPAQTSTATYKVVSGDTLWIISQKFNTTVAELKSLNSLQSDYLFIGQTLLIPGAGSTVSETARIEYISYTVKQGDTPWNIAQQYKIPFQEVLDANKLTTSSYLTIGQTLRIPVHIVPVKSTPGPQYGELLDWWTEAQYVFYTGAVAKVTDFNTGRSFYMKRTTGANHADCETLTSEDTKIMKEIFGNSWQWVNRPVIIEISGRKLAASMAGMPHAGLDSYPANANISSRSGGYGYGLNLDYVKGNNMDGHFDVHFLNSTTHNTGLIDENHQLKVRIAAGK